MREDAQTLDLIFNESPSFMVLTVGPEHVFERANQRFYDVLQLDPSIIGKTVAEVFPEIASQGFSALLDEVFRSGKPYRADEALLQRNTASGGQREMYVTFAYQPVRDVSGNVYGIIHQGYEVTEAVRVRQVLERSKAAIENERENFRNLFRQTPEMVCIMKGPEHVFEFVNEAHIKVLGFNAEGMPVRVAQPESVEVHGILDDVFRTGKTAELHEIPVTVGDRLRYFNLTYAARRDDDEKISGIMILGVEVTDQVHSREALEKALAMRDDFLSIASHELKTPITSLQLQTQLLARRLLKGSSVSTQEFLDHFEVTQKKVKQLTRLIEDMLDVTRINSGRVRYDFVDCDFKSLLTETVEALKEHFDAAGISLSVEAESLQIRADAFRLKQVITNMLTNALKYGEGKPVRISLMREGDHAVLQVADQGIGIAEENLLRIFGRFERAVSSKNVSGLGLGLFISKQIVEAHRGSISVISGVGRGSTFRVAIPAI